MNEVKYLCKNLEVKEGRRLIFEGAFWGENIVHYKWHKISD